MQSKKDLLRRKLFDKYANNWHCVKQFISHADIRNATEKRVACPVCLSLFNEDGLNQDYRDALTLEDVPPRKLGGKPILLTCKICNNTSGHKLDAPLIRQRDLHSFMTGDPHSTTDVYLQMSKEFKTKGKLNIDKVKRIFNFTLNETKSGRVKNYLSSIVDGNSWDGKKINFSIKGPSKRLAHIAELRIGYLIAFSKLGYGLILNNSYQPIRDQIKSPEKKILPNLGVIDAKDFGQPDGLYIVREPTELKSFIVTYSLKSKNKLERRGVLIPGPGVDCNEFYSQQKPVQSKVTLKFVQVSLDLDAVSKPSTVTLAQQIWNENLQNN